MLDASTFINAVSSWWKYPLIIIISFVSCDSFYLIVCFVSYNNPAVFWVLFEWTIFSHPFIFSLSLSLDSWILTVPALWLSFLFYFSLHFPLLLDSVQWQTAGATAVPLFSDVRAEEMHTVFSADYDVWRNICP